MSKRVLLGMITPSSNTVLEPVTNAIVADLPEVSVHFSGFRVIELSLNDQALGQFDNAVILEAAKLLADAHVDVIAWNGTSAGWLGFEADVQLCCAITAATGIRATTSVLALQEICRDRHLNRIGLVTPYLTEVQQRIMANFADAGMHCIAEQHLNLSVNFSFSEVKRKKVASLIHDIAINRPQAIMTCCTNLRAAPLVAELEKEIGIPIYDTVSAVIWKSLKLADIAPASVQAWGSLFTGKI